MCFAKKIVFSFSWKVRFLPYLLINGIFGRAKIWILHVETLSTDFKEFIDRSSLLQILQNVSSNWMIHTTNEVKLGCRFFSINKFYPKLELRLSIITETSSDNVTFTYHNFLWSKQYNYSSNFIWYITLKGNKNTVK